MLVKCSVGCELLRRYGFDSTHSDFCFNSKSTKGKICLHWIWPLLWQRSTFIVLY